MATPGTKRNSKVALQAKRVDNTMTQPQGKNKALGHGVKKGLADGWSHAQTRKQANSSVDNGWRK